MTRAGGAKKEKPPAPRECGKRGPTHSATTTGAGYRGTTSTPPGSVSRDLPLAPETGNAACGEPTRCLSSPRIGEGRKVMANTGSVWRLTAAKARSPSRFGTLTSPPTPTSSLKATLTRPSRCATKARSATVPKCELRIANCEWKEQAGCVAFPNSTFGIRHSTFASSRHHRRHPPMEDFYIGGASVNSSCPSSR